MAKRAWFVFFVIVFCRVTLKRISLYWIPPWTWMCNGTYCKACQSDLMSLMPSYKNLNGITKTWIWHCIGVYKAIWDKHVEFSHHSEDPRCFVEESWSCLNFELIDRVKCTQCNAMRKCLIQGAIHWYEQYFIDPGHTSASIKWKIRVHLLGIKKYQENRWLFCNVINN